MSEYTHTSPSGKRTWRLYGCAKRGCDAVNPDYLAFGVGWPKKRTYCLGHIPLRARLQVWRQERKR